jgi:hypothetical protein
VHGIEQGRLLIKAMPEPAAHPDCPAMPLSLHHRSRHANNWLPSSSLTCCLRRSTLPPSGGSSQVA